MIKITLIHVMTNKNFSENHDQEDSFMECIFSFFE